jgi:hypothetical protein
MGAGHRLATTAAAHCDPLRRRSIIARPTIARADATCSPGPTRSATRTAWLRAVRLNQTAIASPPNPHSARGTGVPHDSRVPSLEAFGRRPRYLPHRRDGPASETLHKISRSAKALATVIVTLFSDMTRRCPRRSKGASGRNRYRDSPAARGASLITLRLWRASIAGRAEPSIKVGAARSSSTVPHELRCISRSGRSPA